MSDDVDGRDGRDDRDDRDGRDDGDDGGRRGLLARGEGDRTSSWLSTYGSPLWRIVLLVALLAALVVLRKPCADGMAGFVGNFGRTEASLAIRDGGVPRHMTQRSGPASGPASIRAAAKGASTTSRSDAAKGASTTSRGDAAPQH